MNPFRFNLSPEKLSVYFSMKLIKPTFLGLKKTSLKENQVNYTENPILKPIYYVVKLRFSHTYLGAK